MVIGNCPFLRTLFQVYLGSFPERIDLRCLPRYKYTIVSSSGLVFAFSGLLFHHAGLDDWLVC